MGKLLIFYLIWRITGSPILAILLLLIVFYFVDRRFIGLIPSFTKPIRRSMHVSRLRRELQLNPHDAPAKQELAEIYIDRRNYRQALELLETIPQKMQAEPEAIYDIGVCHLGLGDYVLGEQEVFHALALNGRIRYGEPYLKLAAAFTEVDVEKSMEYLLEFGRHNFSSCESLYRMALLQAQLSHRSESREALQQCLATYRALPRFRKRVERRWAFLARVRLTLGR